MKIFVAIPKQYAGCGFYRQYQPHNRLAKTKDCDVLLGAGLYDQEDNFNVDADIVQYHKGYPSPDEMKEAQRRGMTAIVDFDDWWRLDTEHLFYRKYLDSGTTETLVNLLRQADYVTVTTERLAVEARKFNKNVVVLPNAWDPNYPQCKPNRVKEDRIVFGYVGGHCHGKDVALLSGLNNKLSGNYKLRLFGYDMSEVYNHYAAILSDNGRKTSHFDWIEKADIWNYPKFYNLMDVSLVPLVDNKFNGLKSELKLIEAGFFKRAVVVSNVHPYKDLIKHKVNAMVVNKPADWFKHCKYLIQNPSAIKDLGEALYETVQPYHIDTVNEKRYKFYQDVLKDKHSNSSLRHSGVQGVHG